MLEHKLILLYYNSLAWKYIACRSSLHVLTLSLCYVKHLLLYEVQNIPQLLIMNILMHLRTQCDTGKIAVKWERVNESTCWFCVL